MIFFKSKKPAIEEKDESLGVNVDLEIITKMNDYSAGGYMKLLEEFDYQAPRDVTNFFVKYNQLIAN